MRMLLATPHVVRRRVKGGLSLEWATSATDIEAAQRLRYRVFNGELGARSTGRTPGCDEDIFDPWCEHLVVRDHDADRIVGTYRILTAERAKRIGAFHAEGHFDLTRLIRLKPGMAEIGRACIEREYRNAATIMLLWQGIARFMRERGLDYLIGCAPIAMDDGGANAVSVYEHAAAWHLAPIEYRVRPRHPLMARDTAGALLAAGGAPVLPPLLKGYLRVGAWIGGEPGWNPDANTADLFLFVPIARVEARYARRYLGAAA
jgi:putative hemolysin